MATFKVEINDNDAEVVLTILKKFKAKVISEPKRSALTEEIALALKQFKKIQEGKIQPLSLGKI